MARLPAQLIRAHEPPLITPFHDRTVHNGKTFGLGPCGYDIRIAEPIVMTRDDPFRLASSMEVFNLPPGIAADVKDKSSWIRRGLMIGNTTCEPGWRGYLTLELFYMGGGELVIEAGDAIAQIVFEQLLTPTTEPYAGKYQDQAAGPQPAIYEGATSPQSTRHKWSEPVRDQYRTVRRCERCRIEKITHHEGAGIPWTSFERDGALIKVKGDNTPPCNGGAPWGR